MRKPVRRLTALAYLAVLAGTAGCANSASGHPIPPRTATPTPQAVAEVPQPASIMPLGDSITDGLGVTGAYRTDLWQFLSTDGHLPAFVGSRSQPGPPQLAQRSYEGHPGWRINQLDARVQDWVRQYKPQVVLLHIGTNDIIQNYRLDSAPARLDALIGHIQAADPEVRIYVATLIPFADGTREARSRRFNAALANIVSGRSARGQQVYLVDLHSALTTADLGPDGVHPTPSGYSKMAAAWYGALTGETLTRWEAEDPGAATVNDGQRLPDPTASNGGRVGFLAAPDSYVQFTVTVAASGSYRLYVRADNSSGTWCSQTLTVNAKPAGTIRYAPYGADQWTMTGADVALKKGANQVRLTHQTCSADLDAIDIAPLNPQAAPGLFRN
jgi:lysophospholipase L1-like esterase